MGASHDIATDLCQGTLIVHTGNILECTEPACIDFDHGRHGFVIDCYDLAGGCSCLELARRRPMRAAS